MCLSVLDSAEPLQVRLALNVSKSWEDFKKAYKVKYVLFRLFPVFVKKILIPNQFERIENNARMHF